ncbi:hypothetical protein [Glaciimonas immobilis]|uniref:Uncharacterized protein n=1 Tax=Glaciimonas immobilis TaxID=728004 RepID=A0A840RYD7_9BURK|nr:hypothetical protein [Glaciimonas immobilis]KAF3998592.1 hypothetical protein HAV38_06985 [Glaciimonas immobilis]MBB5201450.1 hypothetical protein [Glaciimonas immobilis]
MNNYLIFSSFCHHMLLEDEFIILIEAKNQYILLGKNESIILLAAMNSDTHMDSSVVKNLIANGVIVYGGKEKTNNSA